MTSQRFSAIGSTMDILDVDVVREDCLGAAALKVTVWCNGDRVSAVWVYRQLDLVREFIKLAGLYNRNLPIEWEEVQ